MTDIDFDELDRAVNSLVGSQNVQPEPTSSSTVQPQPVSSPAPAQEPVQVAPAPVAPVQTTPAAAPLGQRPLAPAQRGRFLDVVHPQSAMTRGVGPQPSRVAPALTPLAPAPKPTPVYEPTQAPAPNVTAPASIDTPAPAPAGQEPDFVPTSAASTFQADAEPAPDPLVPEGPSPFLSDAVVEKRPLGAFTGPNDTTSLASASEAALEIPEPTPKEEERARPMPAVPPELSGNLVALESETVIPATTGATPSGFGGAGFTGSESAAQASGIEAVFSSGKNGKPLPRPKNSHGHKAWLWLLVGGVVLLIAIGVGVTFYFLVLKK